MESGLNTSQLLQHVIERASKDAQFRRDLLADARGTLDREYDVQMPRDIDLQVVEDSPTSRYLVLPPRQVMAGSDLSDAELEGVAGGWSGASDCGSCGTCVPEQMGGCMPISNRG